MDLAGDINPYLRAIGRLIVNFNALEHSLRRLAWILVDPRDDRPGQIATDGLELSRLEQLVKPLFLHRVRLEALQTEVASLLDQIAAVRGRRNKFAHGFWRVPNNATDLSQISAAKPPTRSKEEYAEIEGSNDPAAIENVATEVYQLGMALDELFEKVKKVLVSEGGNP